MSSDLSGGLYAGLGAQLAGLFLCLFPMMFDFARGPGFADVAWYFSLLYVLAWCIIAFSFVSLAILVARYRVCMSRRTFAHIRSII